jgi:hypothetical protein
MVKKFKYIIWDLPLEGEVPVIFPNFLNHSDFADVIGDRKFIVAAGEGSFYLNSDGRIKIGAFGNSVSLSTKEKQIVSREGDDKLLLCSFVGEDYR